MPRHFSTTNKKVHNRFSPPKTVFSHQLNTCSLQLNISLFCFFFFIYQHEALTSNITHPDVIQILFYKSRLLHRNYPSRPLFMYYTKNHFNHDIIFHYDFYKEIIETLITNETEFFSCSLHKIKRKRGNAFSTYLP